MDTPNDTFDTVGLIPPNPERPSLPIIETKDKVRKSSAWTKEGKREREMSLLILPRPERVTMPAAILPRPERKKTAHKPKREWEIDDSVPIVEETTKTFKESDATTPVISVVNEVNPVTAETPTVNKMDDIPITESKTSIESLLTRAIVEKDSSADTSLNAGQLLLQLVTLLKADDRALVALGSIVNGLHSPDVSSSIDQNKSPVDVPKEISQPIDRTVVPTAGLQIALHHNVEQSVKANIDGTLISLPEIDLHFNQSPETTAEFSGKTPPVAADNPVEEAEVIVYPKQRSKSTKDKSKSKEKTYKSKTKHSKRSKDVLLSTNHLGIENYSPQFPPIHSSIDNIPHGIVTPESASTNIKLLVEEELAREDLWYNVPDIPRDDELENERYSAKGVYTLQDFKNAARRPSRSTGKLYEPPILFSIKKSPPKVVTKNMAAGAGSIKAYDQSFQKVDAVDDLNITSPPKSAEIEKISLLKRSKSLEIPSSRESTAAPAIATDAKQEKPINSVNKPVLEIPAPETGNSTIASAPQAIIPANKPVPIMYDFNPPAPRRVKRRVILNSKEASTQTSRPPSPSPSSSPRGPRPEAIHHPRYYNTAATPQVGPQHFDRATKRLPITAVNAMLEMGASYTGSDKTWIGTLKNVDAGDDLMIVSKPKEEEGKVKSVPTTFAKVNPPVIIENIAPTVETALKSIAEEEHGPLYALLTNLSNSNSLIVDDKPVETTVKKHKEKKDKKEKRSSKEGKPRKDKSKSKSQKSTPLPPVSDTTVFTPPGRLESSPSGTGDIFGDLLGEEIPKWGIPNPSP
jgi:hypothetical protein